MEGIFKSIFMLIYGDFTRQQKGKKYFEYPSKYYCSDIGLRNARLNFRQQEETHIMENIIYNELLCRGYSVDVGVVEIIERNEGKKTKKQCEIDFIVNAGAKKYYIQSALNVSERSKMETELRPLKNAKDFFKKIIVSKTSMKPWTDEDGILHLGLYEFLLNDNALELQEPESDPAPLFTPGKKPGASDDFNAEKASQRRG